MAPTPRLRPLDGIDHQGDQVGVLRAAPGGGDHGAVEPALGLEDAGRVGEQDLRLALDRDPHQPRRAWSAPWA